MFSNRSLTYKQGLLAAFGVALLVTPGVASARPILPGTTPVAPLTVAQAGSEAEAEAAVTAGDYAKAVGMYDKLIAATPKKFKLYLYRGLSYFKLQQFDKSAKDFSTFIELRPNLVEGYLNRAYAYKELGKFNEGLADLAKVESLDPKQVDNKLKGNLQLQKKDYTGAIASYGKIPGALGALLAGDVYAAQGQYPAAIESYTKGITADPKDSYGYGQRGNVYLQTKAFPLAVKDFSQFIVLVPGEPFGYVQRGVANLQIATPAAYTAAKTDFVKYLSLEKRPEAIIEGTRLLGIAQDKSGDKKEAVASYSKVIAANPQDGNTLFARGMVYMTLKDYPGAIKDFNSYATGFASGPNAGDAAYNLGQAYLVTKEYDKAVPAFTAALRLDPKDAASYYGRLIALYSTKQYEKAVADADAVYANDKNPKSEAVIDTYRLQALSYAELSKAGDKTAAAKAITTIGKYVAARPADPVAAKLQSDIVTQVGDSGTQIAIYTANIAKTKDPTELSTLYFNRGIAYVQSKDLVKAIADFTKAGTLTPNDKEVFVVLAQTQASANDIDGSIASYTKAIALNPDKPLLLVERADQYILKKDPAAYAKADADYTSYEAKAGNAVLASSLLSHAQIKRALGKPDEAIALYLRHLSAEKDEANRAISQKQLGTVYFQKADYPNAIKTFSDFLNKDNKDASVYVLRATAYRLAGDTDKAMSDANAALAINANNASALTERGFINNKIGDKAGETDPDKARAAWDASIADCDKAIAADAKFSLAYYCKGFAAYKNASDKGAAEPKYYDTALDAFTKYIAAPATDPMLLTSAKAAVADIKTKKGG